MTKLAWTATELLAVPEQINQRLQPAHRQDTEACAMVPVGHRVYCFVNRAKAYVLNLKTMQWEVNEDDDFERQDGADVDQEGILQPFGGIIDDKIHLFQNIDLAYIGVYDPALNEIQPREIGHPDELQYSSIVAAP